MLTKVIIFSYFPNDFIKSPMPVISCSNEYTTKINWKVLDTENY